MTAATVGGGQGTDESRGTMSDSEEITVTAEKSGWGFRRFLKVLLFISIIAAIVAVIKKVMGERCFVDEEEVVIETDETLDADEDVAADGDADAS